MPMFRCSMESSSFIDLKDNWAIGYSNNQKTKTNIDANNYVDISGDVVTLKRTTNQYGLWIHTPQLEAGKSYMIAFDSFTGDDGNFYCDWSSDISTTLIITQRWATIGCGQNGSSIKGIVFTAGYSAYYGIMIWSNTVSDIVVTNPRLLKI